ncbi:MAG: acyl-CoA synthetase, partial [Longimicrobiales bacterium]
MQLIARALRHPERIAVVSDGDAFSYRQLATASQRVAAALLGDQPDLAEARVAFLMPPGFDWVAVLWGIWRAGGMAVPLGLTQPPAELEHAIRDAQASTVVADPAHVTAIAQLARDCCARFYTTADLQVDVRAREPQVAAERRALMLYTSGTTGKPKGVVHTFASLTAQITSLVDAWQWRSEDRTLLVLPLHHVHGIVNVVGCALWASATCEMMARFDAEATWARIASGELTVFMAVPTIYHRLIASWDAVALDQQRLRSESARRMRLMVSGSAALPVQTLERWREITGHTLLERYGMTEIGMALSSPLHGERRPGCVGMPLPGVDVRIVDEGGAEVPSGTAGELEVRGPSVFREYWRNPEATRVAFRSAENLPPFLSSPLPGFDDWFRTGDVAVVEDAYYRILGRTSIDIIKTGGYKVSALEIEEVLRTHPAVAECAVVGLPDAEWGERVCVALELGSEHELTLTELQDWLRERLAPYK